ncbi:hypothetical protein [Moorena sp. SIO4G3]|uniref:hypothetical protein n=1 Tax=Moorena sp. SIO4G3 TaxID=2607821 RepID=UPI00142C6827|nr:hypothetical protein [Moorena sp. SIO4G3]NEO81727.1 hypothetical protein [Moorena sp. SIO4G3]
MGETPKTAQITLIIKFSPKVRFPCLDAKREWGEPPRPRCIARRIKFATGRTSFMHNRPTIKATLSLR